MKMKKITTILLPFLCMSAYTIKAQIYFNENKVGEYSNALGTENRSTGKFSFVSGYKSVALGQSSFASGMNVTSEALASYSLGAYNSATGIASGAFGMRSYANGTGSMAFGNMVIAANAYSFVIGQGVNHNYLKNTIGSSLMIGFNSNLPTFFVGSASGPGTLGKIGIGTTNPNTLLHVAGTFKANGAATFGNNANFENSITVDGKTTTTNLRITNSPGANKILRSDANGNASWKNIYAIIPENPWEENSNGIFCSENVGIGTNNPNRPLSIKATGNSNNAISFNDKNNNEKWYINLKNGRFNIGKTGSSTYRLAIDDNKLGISCNSPKAKLQVGSNVGSASIGPATGRNIGWGTSYFGFNAHRDPATKIWSSYGDGANNGGAIIYATLNGWIYFSSIASTGTNTKNYTDTDVKGNVLFRLSPNGKLMVKEVEVLADLWPDYVFKKGYTLPKLEEVEQFINAKKHLPDMPSEKEIKTNGLNLGDMDALLLKKIEELTLYTIEQQKQLKAQKQIIDDLTNQIDELKK